MKTHTPSITSWEFYASSISSTLSRNLSEKECSIAMQGYINGVAWQEIAEKIGENK